MFKYKISVYLNRVTTPIKDDFDKAKLYHAKHGIDIEFTFKEVSVWGYKSVFNAYKNRWLIQGAENLIRLDNTADANIFVFDMAEWSTPQGSQFPLKPETPNGSCILLVKPFICVGTYPADHENGTTWVQIAHEIMHSYVQNAILDKIYIPDVMDSYRFNSDPDNPNSNFSQQWELLKPFFATQKPLEATLTRIYDYGKETVGKLTVGANFECNSLELGWRANQSNISSIPLGTYKCIWSFSPKFLKYTYEITGVPNRSGIRIHTSNFFSQLLGCIALGRGYANLDLDGLPDILNSKKTVEEFNNLMGKKIFYLTIK